jgi:hypothetical protein
MNATPTPAAPVAARCAARRFLPDNVRAVFAHIDRCAPCRARALEA